jgi:hypothetical protein
MKTENPGKEFLEYLAANEGKPIDPAVAGAARQELAQGEKTDFKFDTGVSDHEADAINYPEGSLFKTDIPDNELSEAVEKLKDARKTLIDGLTIEPVPELFRDPQHVTFGELEGNAATLPEATRNALNVVGRYAKIGPETSLYDVPDLIKDFLLKLDAIETHRDNLEKHRSNTSR